MAISITEAVASASQFNADNSNRLGALLHLAHLLRVNTGDRVLTDWAIDYLEEQCGSFEKTAEDFANDMLKRFGRTPAKLVEPASA